MEIFLRYLYTGEHLGIRVNEIRIGPRHDYMVRQNRVKGPELTLHAPFMGAQVSSSGLQLRILARQWLPGKCCVNIPLVFASESSGPIGHLGAGDPSRAS